MTRDEILNMPAGRAMRKALVDAGLWNANDKRDPSKDIAAAWVMVEKIRAMIIESDYEHPLKMLELFSIGDGFAANFSDASIHVEDWIEIKDGEYSVARANTAPLAICRAALLATQTGEQFP